MAFTLSELAALEGAQESSMSDIVVPWTRSAVADSYGQPVESFTEGEPTAAGISITPGREIAVGERTVVIDATARLKRSAYGSLAQGDQLVVTHRNGVLLAQSETFELVGLPALGPSGLVWNLQRVIL